MVTHEKSPMYHIIICLLTSLTIGIAVASYGFLRRSKMANVVVQKTLSSKGDARVMETIIQLSTYIYVYVDNYQNEIHVK